MGRDPSTSVLNSFNQSHDIANLFVTDGASFCSTAPQNPSLSFMAFTARAVDYALKEQAAGRL
jgi:choline dehydrogenase-like flavoprotein